jgi:ppGpp synthetase/RelA/SpoT-type nucleotidyltranferase
MPFVIPQYSRQRVNAAGRSLIQLRDNWLHSSNLSDSDYMMVVTEYAQALEIVNNWRSSHSGPLLYLRMLLTNHAKRVDREALIAQRIKRLSSIELKLERFPTMTLSQMQDIGGCRAIVETVEDVRRISTNFQASRTQHIFNNCDDYIETPQRSGYRGIHLIYRFRSKTGLNPCNNLKIEIQIRSLFQHAWATAVETVGILTKQALKSSQGETEWLRFFELMGTVFAVLENTPRVRDTPANNRALVDAIGHFDQELGIINRLKAFRQALREVEQSIRADARYFLLELAPGASAVTVRGFRAQELPRATDLYTDIEKKVAEEGGDIVLVSVDSLTSLRKAYPNYFLDTALFLEILEETLRDGL